jgi:release factor glutamine methyltransferase
LTEERARRRPLQHLTGTQAFWRHEFLVSPDVLIPRPETELLVEAALEDLRDTPGPTVVDVGTGSGCLALSLAAERPDAAVHAIDVSEAALAVARENARRLGLESRVTFHLGDLLGSVRSLRGRIQLVVSNPPYVDPSEAASLAPEVRDHEPTLALFPPGDRYSVYRRLAPAAAAALGHDGALMLEVGLGMAEEVRRICEASGLAVQQVKNDLQGIPRAIVARRMAGPTTG